MREEKRMSYLCYNILAGGYHEKPVKIDSTDENLCAFIVRIKLSECYTITDNLDNFVLNTIGNFIDRCADKELLERLLPILMPMQMGEVPAPKIKYIEY